MAASVNFFNSSTRSLNVQINNGGSFTIPAATPPSFTPGAPTANPSFSGRYPEPGSLGMGRNLVQLTPEGSTPLRASLELPDHVQWFSIQIYVFSQTDGSYSWVLLNNGQLVAQGTAQ
jgi:hypothetical protein